MGCAYLCDRQSHFIFVTPLPPSTRRVPSQFTFEIRKVVHMLFIPFIIAVCFHTPTLCAVGAILLTWYIMDRLYFTTRM